MRSVMIMLAGLAALAAAGPSCSRLADPDLDDAPSVPFVKACAADLAAEPDRDSFADDANWLAARARRLAMSGFAEEARSATLLLRSAISNRAAPVPAGIHRVDQPGNVNTVECLPLWHMIEHSRDVLAGRKAGSKDQVRQQLANIVGAHRRPVGQSGGSRALHTGLSDDEVLDMVASRSREVECDTAAVEVRGEKYDIVFVPGDDRFADNANSVPVHGWAFDELRMFVPDEVEDMCAVGGAGDASCLLADGTAEGGVRGGARVLFPTPAHHAREVRAATRRGRKLAIRAFTSSTRSRGDRSRLYITTVFPDRKWFDEDRKTGAKTDLTDQQVLDKFRKATRVSVHRFSAQSYGAMNLKPTVPDFVYELVNCTYAQASASRGEAKIEAAAKWIVKNHPTASRRVDWDSFDYSSVTFPFVNAFVWAGLANKPGRWVWVQGTYRDAEYVHVHEDGHNLGMSHAGFLKKQYGNENDVMGCCGVGDYMSPRKFGMHWIPRALTAELTPAGPTPSCKTCSRGGPFFMVPHDTGTLPSAYAKYATDGAAASPPRGDDGTQAHGVPAAAGQEIFSALVSESPATASGGNTRAQTWLDAKASADLTGAGEIQFNVADVESAVVSMSSYQPVTSRTEWKRSGLRRGSAYVTYGERLAATLTNSATPRVSDALLDRVAAGERPALLVEGLAEHDAPAFGLYPPAATKPAGAAALSAEPSPIAVGGDFDTVPFTPRSLRLEDKCWSGAPAGSGDATVATPACSSVVRPVVTRFLGPSGELATLGAGCSLAAPDQCQAAPLTGHGTLDTSSTPSSTPQAVTAFLAASSGLTYRGSVTAGRVDSPARGAQPRARLVAPVTAPNPTAIAAVACVAPRAGATVPAPEAAELFLAAYRGDHPVSEIALYGADPSSAMGPLAIRSGSDLKAAAAEAGTTEAALRALCGSSATPALLVTSLGDDASDTRVRTVRAFAANGNTGAALGSYGQLSTHAVPGSALPSVYLVAGARRNNTLTRTWAQAVAAEAASGTALAERAASAGALTATLHLFAQTLAPVKEVTLEGRSYFSGDWAVHAPSGLYNGRYVWTRVRFSVTIYMYFRNGEWLIGDSVGSPSYYAAVTPPAGDDGTILGASGGAGKAPQNLVFTAKVTPTCDTGTNFDAGQTLGTAPRPINGACSPCPAGKAAVGGACACPAGEQPSGSSCVPCPKGTYKAAAGDVACTACPGSASTAATGALSSANCGKSVPADDPFTVSAAGRVEGPAVTPATVDFTALPAASTAVPGRHGWCRTLVVSGVTGDAADMFNGVARRRPGAILGARPVYTYTDDDSVHVRAYAEDVTDANTVAGSGDWTLWRNKPFDQGIKFTARLGEPTRAGSAAAPYLHAMPSGITISMKTKTRFGGAETTSDVDFRCACDNADPFSNTAPAQRPCLDVGAATGLPTPASLGIVYDKSCPVGFKPAAGGASGCVDIDECAITPSVCGTLTCRNAVGSYQCLCPKGSAGLDVAADVCTSCEAGTFSPDGSRCLPCPAGTTSPAGATSADQCACLPGTYRAQGASSGPCVAPDTSVLRLGTAAALLVAAPAYLPTTPTAATALSGLASLSEPAAQAFSTTRGSAAHAARAAGTQPLPLMWGSTATTGACVPAPPSDANAAPAPWWVGNPSASLSGFAADPSDTAMTALASFAGIIGGASPLVARAREATPSDDTDKDGPAGRLPAGVGAHADLGAFAAYGTSACGGQGTATFLLPAPRLSRTLALPAVTVRSGVDSLARAAGASAALADAMRPRIPAVAAPGANPPALASAVFARPAASDRQPFDGPVLAVGTTPHDDGRRVAAVTAPDSAARSVARDASVWKHSAALPATLASGTVDVYDAGQSDFARAARSPTSVGAAHAAAEASSSVANTVGRLRASAAASARDALAGSSCVVAARALVAAACPADRYLDASCDAAVDATAVGTGAAYALKPASSPAACKACTACPAGSVELHPCTALADRVCAAGTLPAGTATCHAAPDECGASSACGKCAVGQWCAADADCDGTATCVTGGSANTRAAAGAPTGRQGVCLPAIAQPVGKTGSTPTPALGDGILAAVPVAGHALTARDFAPAAHRAAVEAAARWSVRARTAGRGDAIVTLVAAIDVGADGGTVNARLEHLESLVLPASATAAAPDSSSLRAAHRASAVTDSALAAAADGFTSIPPGRPAQRFPAVDGLQTAGAAAALGSGTTAVLLLLRAVPVAPPTSGSTSVRTATAAAAAPVPYGAARITSPDQAIAAVTSAFAAAAVDTATTSSVPALARAFLGRSAAAQKSLAARLVATQPGTGARIPDPAADAVRAVSWEDVAVTTYRANAPAVRAAMAASVTCTPNFVTGTVDCDLASPAPSATATPTPAASGDPSASAKPSVTASPTPPTTGGGGGRGGDTGNPSPAASASPTPTPAATPSATPQPIDCVVSAPRTSNCTKKCGNGGAAFTYRRILSLPLHGGAACPAPASLLSRQQCPAAAAAGLPACPASDPCDVRSPPCGAGQGACSLCPYGRKCSSAADCAAGLACRARGASPAASAPTMCLKPMPATPPGASAPPPIIEESVPDLTSVVSGGASAPAMNQRQPAATDKAAGVVLQLRLAFASSAVLRSPAAVEAVKAALKALVTAMRLPAGATVSVDFVPPADAASARRARALQASATATTATASIGVDLDEAGQADTAAVAAASGLGSALSANLASSSATVGTAIGTALAEAAPEVADGGVTMEGPPLFAVVAASDGAVIAGSPSVRAAAAVTPSPSPSPAPGPNGITGPAIAGFVAAMVIALFIGVGAYVLNRRRRIARERAVASAYKPDPAAADATKSRSAVRDVATTDSAAAEE